MVTVDRSSPRHTLVDLDVSSSLLGDFTAAHTSGDNAHVPAEGTVLRDDAPPAEVAWQGAPGSC